MIDYGIWGCGVHAEQHVQRDIPGLGLTAVCDIKEEKMERMRQKFGAELLSFTIPDVFLESGINAVVIATPDVLHIEHLQKSLMAGLHTLVEKPIVVERKKVHILENMLAHAADDGLVLTSCHPRRFDPPFMWLRDNARRYEDVLGRIISFDLDFSYEKPRSGRKWFPEGLMLHHASHEIDLLNFVLGYSPFRARKIVDSPDRFEIYGIRHNKVTFYFRGTLCLNRRTSHEVVEIRYERGSVRLDAHSGTVVVSNHDDECETTLYCGAKNWEVRSRGVMENFVQAILGKEPNYLTAQDILVSALFGLELHIDGETIFS